MLQTLRRSKENRSETHPPDKDAILTDGVLLSDVLPHFSTKHRRKSSSYCESLHELRTNQTVTSEHQLEDHAMNPYRSDAAPRTIGPYSHAMRTGNLLFCSGQTPLDAATMCIVSTDIKRQTFQAIWNLRSILTAAGLELSNVVKTSVFLSDMSLFTEMNAAYAECFGEHQPARTTIAVKGLPYGALVEIECIAEFAEDKGE